MFFMCFIMPIHFKKKIICNLILIFGLSIATSQNEGTLNLDPTLQSLILPGWGQNTLGFKSRSNTFFYTESAILISILATNKFSNEIKRNYIAFASNHAFDITGRPPTIGIASRLDASGLKKYFIFLGPKTCVSFTICSKIAL